MFYSKSVTDVLKSFDTNTTAGLTTKEAEKRLEKFGPNILPEKKKPPIFFKFFAQFQNVLVIILLIATFLSFLLGDTIDAVAIFTIVLLNATIGFVQEVQAEKTLASLKEQSITYAFVLRDGKTRKIPTAEIVPGDVVILEEGSTVPADGRIIEAFAMMVDESILTGESLPEEKNEHMLPAAKLPLGDQVNMVFKDTKVTAGRGNAVIVATGKNTEIGKIAQSLETQEIVKTPLTIELDRVAHKITILVGVIAVAIFSINMIGRLTFVDSLLVSISLAVAAIPEGLPAIVTIVLSLGVKRLALKKTIIKKLTAVETLGAIRIIATDKTGTITQNKINVTNICLPDGNCIRIGGIGYQTNGMFYDAENIRFNPEKHPQLQRVLESAILASNATIGARSTVLGDTTEGALVVAGHRAHLDSDTIRRKKPKIHENPFTSDRKMMSVVIQEKERVRLIAKGAPEIIVSLCTDLTEGQRKKILSKAEEFSKEGLRSLAIAEKALSWQPSKTRAVQDPGGSPTKGKEGYAHLKETGLTYLGLFGMQDPLRPEVKQAIAEASVAGIRTIMITGDHKATAAAIAREAGIIADEVRNEKWEAGYGSEKWDISKSSNLTSHVKDTLPTSHFPRPNQDVLTESDIDDMTDKQLTEALKKGASVFARISPLGKLRLIQALKRIPHMQVAVTGDGVNDAPALKASHIGIAMGKTGTDLTREVADMVITDDNYATIITAIQEGRVIFANLVKFIRYLISCNLSEIIVVTLGVVFSLPPPLLPIQILWINLITDGFPALALGMDPPEKDIMKRPPRDLSQGILHKKRWSYMVAEGTIIGVSVFLLFLYTYELYSYEVAQTLTFSALGLSQLVHAFNNRSTRLSIFHLGIITNKYLVVAAAVSALLQYLVVQSNLGNLLFKTTPIPFFLWLSILAVSFFPLAVVELKKQLRFRVLP